MERLSHKDADFIEATASAMRVARLTGDLATAKELYEISARIRASGDKVVTLPLGKVR